MIMATESGSHGEFTFALSDDTLDTTITPVISDDTDDSDFVPSSDDHQDTFQFEGDFTGHSASIFDDNVHFDTHMNTQGGIDYSIVFLPPTSDDVWSITWDSANQHMVVSHNGVDLDLGL
jgi:hypothetical protein